MAETLFSGELTGESATQQLGRELAGLLRPGDVVALYGELGTGKTCLVRGLAAGLGIDERWVASPSFTLINEYPGNPPLFHLDGYRLNRPEEVASLGLEEYLDGPGITVIEWAERFPDLPEDRWEIRLTFIDADRRKVTIEGRGRVGHRFKGGRALKFGGKTERESPKGPAPQG